MILRLIILAVAMTTISVARAQQAVPAEGPPSRSVIIDPIPVYGGNPSYHMDRDFYVESSDTDEVTLPVDLDPAMVPYGQQIRNDSDPSDQTTSLDTDDLFERQVEEKDLDMTGLMDRQEPEEEETIGNFGVRLDFPQGPGFELGFEFFRWLGISMGVNYLPFPVNVREKVLVVRMLMADVSLDIYTPINLTIQLGGVYNGNQILIGNNIGLLDSKKKAESYLWYPQMFGPFVGLRYHFFGRDPGFYLDLTTKVYWLGTPEIAGSLSDINKVAGKYLKYAQFWVDLSLSLGVSF